MLNRCGAQLVGQGLKHGFARGAVIREDTHFDQAVGVQGGIGFFLDSGAEPVTADHHNRVKMVRQGAVFLALGRSQLNLRHGRIIGDWNQNESEKQEQQSQQGLVE